MTRRRSVTAACVSVLALVMADPVLAQRSVADVMGRPAASDGQPTSLLEEVMLSGYVENSYVWNLGHTGRDDVNELRYYDADAGYSFNMALLGVKKESSGRYPFGFGVVLAAGLDAQKNHAIGMFRDDDDAFPFRNTSVFDLQEAYGAYKAPIGKGLTLKAGKFVTLVGSEVIDSPSNLNFSRSFLFSFAMPLTHVGALGSYAVTDRLTVTVGPVVGWDVADDNNDHPSWIGQLAFTPVKNLTTNLTAIVGPEQFDNTSNQRWLFDLVVSYTGIRRVTLGLNVDYGREDNEPGLVARGTRSSNGATWWGSAVYAAYDWTDTLRTAVRGEYFRDADGVRTGALGAGRALSLWEVTATVQYKIWRGLVGRVEYRHDDADAKVFKVRAPGLTPTSTFQDTITFSLSYSLI